jgi:hypothetical protein
VTAAATAAGSGTGADVVVGVSEVGVSEVVGVSDVEGGGGAGDVAATGVTVRPPVVTIRLVASATTASPVPQTILLVHALMAPRLRAAPVRSLCPPDGNPVTRPFDG